MLAVTVVAFVMPGLSVAVAAAASWPGASGIAFGSMGVAGIGLLSLVPGLIGAVGVAGFSGS